MFENEKVYHTKWGDGKVISLKGDNLEVKFNGEIKRLKLWMIIEKKFLTFENPVIQKELEYEYITKPQEIKLQEEIKQKERLEEEERRKNEVLLRAEQVRLLEEERKKEILRIQELELNEAKEYLLESWHELGFEGFLHTTELCNFKKIIASGCLIPRNRLDGKNDFCDVANQEVIAHTNNIVKDSCRFYYYFKTPTNYRANYKHPVILVFDEKLLDNDRCYFTSCNAAKNYNGLTHDVKKARSFPWDGIFERGEHSMSKYWNQDDSENSKLDIVGMRNAEFLINDNVSVSFIKKIYFKNKADLIEASVFCSEEMQSKFCFDRSKFN